MTPLVPGSPFLAHVLVAALGFPLLLLQIDQPRRCRIDTKMVIKNVEAALVHFQTENTDSCAASLAELVTQKILQKVPLDTWGQPLLFVCPGFYNPDGADIVSAGRDGIFGTADDIESWQL